MRNSIFLFLFFSMVSVAHSQTDSTQNWFSIKAFVPQWKGAKATLLVEGEVVNRQELTNDIYSYNSAFTAPKLAVLSLQKRGGSLFVPLFIEPGLVRIRTQTQYNLIPYGSPLNDLYAAAIKTFDSAALSQPPGSFQSGKDIKRQLATAFIRQYPASYVSLKLLQDFFYLDQTASDTLYYSLFDGLDAGLKATPTGRKIEAEAAVRFATAVGREAPLLVLPTASNGREALYKKGGFTLLNFWASWCVPCRKEHPALKKLAAKYSPEVFSIVGVSLDANPAFWLKAIRDEQLSWKQLGDGKGWDSPAAKQYGIKTIPANFLLDRNGVLLGKNLTVEEIEKKLAALISDKTY